MIDVLREAWPVLVLYVVVFTVLLRASRRNPPGRGGQ